MPDVNAVFVKLVDTSPVLALALGIVYVFWKLGALYITKHFEKMVPVYERGVAAIERGVSSVEKLTAVGEDIAKEIVKEQRALGTATRALWGEFEATAERRGEAKQP